MSFFEIFEPGQRHSREQRDFEKISVEIDAEGGKDWDRRHGVDLEAGTFTLPASSTPQATPEDPGDEGED